MRNYYIKVFSLEILSKRSIEIYDNCTTVPAIVKKTRVMDGKNEKVSCLGGEIQKIEKRLSERGWLAVV